MHSILFVCTANQCRSPVAAGLFSKLLQQYGFLIEEWNVESAGTWTLAGKPALRRCRDAAMSFGVDISSHRSQAVSDVNLDIYHLIIVMERGHYEALILEYPGIKNRIYMLSTLAGVLNKDIPDPVLHSTESVVEIIKEILEYLQMAFGPICQLAMKADPP